MQSVSQFWQQLIESQILCAKEAEKLKQTIVSTGITQQVDAIAAWLITQKKISQYQATGCLTGAFTSFCWGDFLLVEPIEAGIFKYQFRAKHIPTGQMVILIDLNKIIQGDDGRSTGVLEACDQLFAIDFSKSAPCEVVVHDQMVRASFIDRGGTALGNILSGGTRLSVSLAAAIAASVADDLANLHEVELFHGGVCPETIWIPGKGTAQLLLIPPWLCKSPLRGSLDHSSANYAAPELTSFAHTASARSDLYALGCTLFEMLCGHPPFPGNQRVEEKLQRHAQEPIKFPQSLAIPEQMKQIVRYLMAKDEKIRYRSGATVAEALQVMIDANDLPKERLPVNELARYMQTALARRQSALDDLREKWKVLPLPPIDSALSQQNRNSESESKDKSLDPPTATSEASQAARAITLASHQPSQIPSHVLNKKRKRIPLIIGVALLILIAVGTAIIIQSEQAERTRNTKTNQPDADSEKIFPASNDDLKHAMAPSLETLSTNKQTKEAVDDGKALWQSPTNGKRPQIRFLAPGPQMILIARISRSERGPWADALRNCGISTHELSKQIEKQTGFKSSEIARIDMGFYDAGRHIETVKVFHLSTPHSVEAFLKRWGATETIYYAGEAIYRAKNRYFYLPSGKTTIFCDGPRNRIEQVIDWLGEETSLDSQRVDAIDGGSNSMTALANAADADRDVTLIFNTNFIRSFRDSLYPGSLQPIHAAISYLLGPGENIQAGLFSVHLGRTLFCELQLFCTRDKQPDLVAKEIHSRLQQGPSQINEYLLSLSQTISRYSRATIALLPDMLRSLVRYTRHDQDHPRGNLAILRAHLPVNAASHLGMAAELLLWEIDRPGLTNVNDSNNSIPEKLTQLTNLSFERDNLRNAINQLSAETGIAMKILGNDLEIEGITLNQSFEIDMRNKPAQMILLNIVRLANPIKSASLADSEQKLIYVIKHDGPGGDPILLITTRAAAEKRGDTIPPIFTNED